MRQHTLKKRRRMGKLRFPESQRPEMCSVKDLQVSDFPTIYGIHTWKYWRKHILEKVEISFSTVYQPKPQKIQQAQTPPAKKEKCYI